MSQTQNIKQSSYAQHRKVTYVESSSIIVVEVGLVVYYQMYQQFYLKLDFNTKWGNRYYIVEQLSCITKWGKLYYKVGQLLSITKWVSYYKV